MNILYLDQPQYMNSIAEALGFGMPGHKVIPGRVVRSQDDLSHLLTKTGAQAIITDMVLDTWHRGAEICRWVKAIDSTIPLVLYVHSIEDLGATREYGVQPEQVVKKVEAEMDAPNLLKALGL